MTANNKYNPEGYLDSTAYTALENIDRQTRSAGRSPNYRPLVYICSPYKGDVEKNVQNARDYCRVATERGYIPIAPHLLFPQFLNDSVPEDRELGMFMGLVLLTKCKEMWVFGEVVTEGMAAEIDSAKRKDIRVRNFSSDYREVTT